MALCRTSDEVIRAFDEFFRRAASVTAQRYYVGPTYLAGALFLQGEAVHFYAGEETVMWPPLTGRAFELRSAGEPHFSALLQSAETVSRTWNGPGWRRSTSCLTRMASSGSSTSIPVNGARLTPR